MNASSSSRVIEKGPVAGTLFRGPSPSGGTVWDFVRDAGPVISLSTLGDDECVISPGLVCRTRRSGRAALGKER